MIVTLFLLVVCPISWAVEEQSLGAGVVPAAAETVSWVPEARYVTLKNPGKEVFVKNRAGEWVPAEDGMVILPGDEVRTAAKDSTVEVILDGGKVGHIELKEGSLFKVLEAEVNPATGDKKTLLDLAVGKILVKAEALTGASQFEVRTPSAIAGVRGTMFEVEVKGGSETA